MVIGPKRNLSTLHVQSRVELDLGRCQLLALTDHDMT